jgi:hypothetical protein
MVAKKATISVDQVQAGPDGDQKRSVRKEVQARQGAKCIDQYAPHSLVIKMIKICSTWSMSLSQP